MRAWQLGVVLTVIGAFVIYYALYYLAGQTSWMDYMLVFTIGWGFFFIGIGILGIKFRQWIEHH